MLCIVNVSQFSKHHSEVTERSKRDIERVAGSELALTKSKSIIVRPADVQGFESEVERNEYETR